MHIINRIHLSLSKTATVLALLSAIAFGLQFSANVSANTNTDANNLQVGDTFPALVLQNQFQQQWQVPAGTEAVYFASNREAGDWMTELLAELPADYLESRRAVYMADLSAMPGFVTTMFALPALRQQPYNVGVVFDEQTLAGWPQDEKAMIEFKLDDGQITAIERLGSIDALRQSLGL